MNELDAKVINAINHYKYSLIKYSTDDNVDESKLLYYIQKLHYCPVTIERLEETGIGLTLNGLRRFDGEVRDAADDLINKWKLMVVAENEEENVDDEKDKTD